MGGQHGRPPTSYPTPANQRIRGVACTIGPAHSGTYALEASALRSEVHRYRLTVPLWLVLWLTVCLDQRKDAFHVEV